MKYPNQDKAYRRGTWSGDGVRGAVPTKADRDRRRAAFPNRTARRIARGMRP